jgi:hypothetical protein
MSNLSRVVRAVVARDRTVETDALTGIGVVPIALTGMATTEWSGRRDLPHDSSEGVAAPRWRWR